MCNLFHLHYHQQQTTTRTRTSLYQKKKKKKNDEEEESNMNFMVKSNSPSPCYCPSSSPVVLHALFRPMSSDFSHPPFAPHDHSTPPLTIILTLILLAFLIVGFFSIYFCRCVMDSFLHSRHPLRRSPSGNLLHPSSDSPSAPPGLDPLLINSFPTFPYSGIKEFRSDKFGLECAICLLEFDDDSLLRLLTVCCHVFHQECIDLWLESHKTCPVCRGNLDSDSPRNSVDKPPDPPPPPPLPRAAHHESIEDAISIDIDDDDDDDDADGDADVDENRGKQRTETEKEEEEERVKRFSRSHSTGHSIAAARREEEDRHKLRLPEHVKIKILRGHNWTGSCVTFEEFLRNPGNGGGLSELSGSDDRSNLQRPP